MQPPATDLKRPVFATMLPAAVLLVGGSSLVTASLLRREPAPVASVAPVAPELRYAAASFGPDQQLGPAYDAARQALATQPSVTASHPARRRPW